MRAKVLVFCLLMSSLATVSAKAADYSMLTDVRVHMDDGILLATDVYIPTASTKYSNNRYPCVVELTPYRKEMRGSEGASYLPGQGILLIEADARGTGGSQGQYNVVFSTREQRDTAQLVDWAATGLKRADGSNLCEDKVGLYGGSYSGIIQYLTASLPLHPGDVGYGRLPLGSEHLAAIAPQRAYGDLYRDIVYHGGMVIGSFGVAWSGGTTAFYTEPPTDVATSSDAQSAWINHTGNDSIILNYLQAPYADATYTKGPLSQRLYEDSSTLPRIANLRVPALALAGFFDAFTRGQLMMFHQAHALEAPGRGPNFLIVGPWTHSYTHFINPDLDGFKAKLLSDWYHWWLEDADQGGVQPSWIANGFDGNGARVKWCQMLTGKANVACSGADGTWQNSQDWPPQTHVERLHFRAGGSLTSASPSVGEGSDLFVSNPTAGLGETPSRWDNAAYNLPFLQQDQRIDQPKGIGYQTAPLDHSLTIAGPIGMTLWASITGAQGNASLASSWPALGQATPPYLDTDFIVKLSDVAPDGTATLVTDGFLRASHRAYDLSKSVTMDGEVLAPYHLHTLASLDPATSGVAREYKIEIWPTGKTFAAGHRLRIDIYSSDTPEHITILNPVADNIFHSSEMDSYLAFPVAG